MKKVSVIGHFGYGLECLDGQTIKTKIVTKELEKIFGREQVKTFDTHGGVKTLLKAPVQGWKALQGAKNVLMLPAHNGLRVFGRLLPFLRGFFPDRKIHYVVVGGWLPVFLEKRKGLARVLKKFDALYVETKTMQKALERMGFSQVFVMPNCKELTPAVKEDLVYQMQKPYKLCTFSRVMKEKGIEDAIEAVKAANEKIGETAFSLDIYGQVDGAQTEWFDSLQKEFPPYIQYDGLVSFDKSVDVLKNYFALLFPTYYHGEGFAGTLIDAYSAGVPVIASDWKYNPEIVSEDVGFVFPTRDVDAFAEILCRIYADNSLINDKKEACLARSRQYLPENAMQVLIDNMQ